MPPRRSLITYLRLRKAKGFPQGVRQSREILPADNYHDPFECGYGSMKTLADEVGHLDEEGPRITMKTWFDHGRTSKAIKTIEVQVIVVAHVEGRAGIRRPAKQKLSLDVCAEG